MRWMWVALPLLLLSSCAGSGSESRRALDANTSVERGSAETEDGSEPGAVTVRVVGSEEGLADYGIATLTLDPERPPTAADRFVHVLATEADCASGRVPSGRDVAVVVKEGEEGVSIAVLIAPVVGAVECPTNPWFSFEVPLQTDLGDRVILDGLAPNASELQMPVVEPQLLVEVAGTPPTPGRANVFAWTGDLDGGLLLTDFFPLGGEPTWIQSFPGTLARTITGFVTECGDDCVEECEAEGCAALRRLGPECEYGHDPSGTDVVIRITYNETSCSITVGE